MKNLALELFKPGKLVSGVLSHPFSKQGPSRIDIRPVTIKGELQFQFTSEEKNQAFHINLEPALAEQKLLKLLESFKEAHFFTPEADIHAIFTKAGDWKILKKKGSKTLVQVPHNRKKQYLLDGETHAPFWHALGIAGEQGSIKPAMQAKFRQVNRYVELLRDVISSFPEDKPLTILDFGCGKAYLTFALYEYLVNTLKRSVNMIGVDLKESVVKNLQEISNRLSYKDLHFYAGDIKTFPIPERVDLVISLHACDTATDLVIDRALEAKAQGIVVVPCCQHAFFSKIESKSLKPLLKHGILKERFSALATDAARAAVLELAGYAVQVLEFVEMEHTPKNLMIRALKSKAPQSQYLKEEYQVFLEEINLK